MKNVTSISPLTLAIFCQLLIEPKTGYDLKKTFEETPMGHFSASPGAIYPAIKRMEKLGWIVGRKENADSMRPSKVLSITDAGLDYLRNYFRRPVEKHDVIHNMDQLLLRFALMTPLLGRPATIEYLQQFISRLSSYLEELKAMARQYENNPLEGRLALQHGIDSYEMHLRWACRSLTALTENA